MLRPRSSPTRSRAVVLAAALLVAACGPKDSDVQLGVNAALVDAPGITASVTDGVVTLAGAYADSATASATEAKVKALRGVKSVVVTTTVTPPPPPAPAPAPVVLSPDDAMLNEVAGVLANFPTLSASVASGVITVTGEIAKADVSAMMQALSALHPKKIDNQARIKK